MTEFVIRPGTLADIDGVAALHMLSRDRTYKSILIGYQSQPLTSHWRGRYPAEASFNRLLVASTGHELIGFVYVGQATLFAIHVHPDWHGRGVGPALMRAGRETLVDFGFRSASLWVIEGNERACRFYERDGWRRSGRTRQDEVGGVAWPQLEYVRELDVTTQMWHNPDCSKCAAATSALGEAGVEVTLRPYLTDAPTRAELASVLQRLKAEPWDICRTGEPAFSELGMADWPRSSKERDRWIEAMVTHPVLIQRPIILLADGSAFVARTPAALAEVIDRTRPA